MKLDWFALSIVGLIVFSLMSTLIAFVTRKGTPVSFVLLVIGLIFTVFYFAATFIFSSYKIQLDIKLLSLLVFIGLLSCVGNLAVFQAVKIAPNAGLAIAISGVHGGIVVVLATVFLKDKITPLQLVGLILAIVAIILINIGSKSSGERKPEVKGTSTSVFNSD